MSESEQGVTQAELDAHIFRKSVPMQVMLQEVARAMGDPDDRDCLVIGSTNAMLSYQLRRSGGSWKELVFDETTASNIHEIVGEAVPVYDGESLPFHAKSFDIVVVIGGVEAHAGDADFIQKCHHVMKPDGRLVVCVPREKTMSLVAGLCAMLGIDNSGYTERHLFGILKNGFDVMQMRAFSRFFMESVDAAVYALARRRQLRPPAGQLRLYTVAYVFYWLAYQLDLLIFFVRGHRLVASAKRRGWRSRDAPILVDGRSISEAVLRPIAK